MLQKFFCFAVLLLISAMPMLAQSSSPSTTPSTRPARQQPCWQVAGIEKSAMEQRWALERETRLQVEAVCTNSSLTPQQKRQQVRDIREQARQKMEGILTQEQEQALTACQQQRAGTNRPAPHPGMGGPCGEMPSSGSQPSGPNGAPGSNGGTSNPPPSSSPQN
jgi:Spy/CpxP family protein refolding chaperone